jgi:hypothetical protein
MTSVASAYLVVFHPNGLQETRHPLHSYIHCPAAHLSFGDERDGIWIEKIPAQVGQFADGKSNRIPPSRREIVNFDVIAGADHEPASQDYRKQAVGRSGLWNTQFVRGEWFFGAD